MQPATYVLQVLLVELGGRFQATSHLQLFDTLRSLVILGEGPLPKPLRTSAVPRIKRAASAKKGRSFAAVAVVVVIASKLIAVIYNTSYC